MAVVSTVLRNMDTLLLLLTNAWGTAAGRYRTGPRSRRPGQGATRSARPATTTCCSRPPLPDTRGPSGRAVGAGTTQKPGNSGAVGTPPPSPSTEMLFPLRILLSSRMWQALTGTMVCAPPRTFAKPPPSVEFSALTLLVQSLDELEWLDSC